MANINYSSRKAQKLLKEVGITTIPVSLDDICKHLGIRVKPESFDKEVSGCLVVSGDDKVIIGVNSKHHNNRTRFTIAHEIGHFLLHKGKTVHVDKEYRINFRNKTSGLATDIEEIEANTFAAELLMPASFLNNDILKYSLDFENDEIIQKLAEDYKVSQLAMTLRLVNLGYLPSERCQTP